MEYAVARNFYISRADMLDMPYAEVRFWLKKLEREMAQAQRDLKHAGGKQGSTPGIGSR